MESRARVDLIKRTRFVLWQTEIFDVIRKGDVLFQHPYHSFVTSTQHFVEAASIDPKVLVR